MQNGIGQPDKIAMWIEQLENQIIAAQHSLRQIARHKKTKEKAESISHALIDIQTEQIPDLKEKEKESNIKKEKEKS